MFYERKRIRVPVNIPVTLTTVLDSTEGTIINLTEDGARIACRDIQQGERVQIEYQGQTLFARCMWSEVDRIGVTFPFPLSDGPLLEMLHMARAPDAQLHDRASPPPAAPGGFGRRINADR